MTSYDAHCRYNLSLVLPLRPRAPVAHRRNTLWISFYIIKCLSVWWYLTFYMCVRVITDFIDEWMLLTVLFYSSQVNFPNFMSSWPASTRDDFICLLDALGYHRYHIYLAEDLAPTGAGWPIISGSRDRPHQPFLFLEHYAKWSFVWYKNLDRNFFCFVTIHAFDWRTDRRLSPD